MAAGDASAVKGTQPSARTASALNDLITRLAPVATREAPAVIVIPLGEWTFDAQIELASYVHIRGVRPGGVTIVADGLTGTADDPTNAMFRATEVVGAISTTLSAAADHASYTLQLTDATGVTAGMWLRLAGNNNVLGDPGPYNPSMGASLTTYELVCVASNDGGGQVTLTAPLRWYRAAGVTVVAVTPVIGAGVFDLNLDGDTGPVACGIHLRGAVDCVVQGIGGKNFSRSIVCADRGGQGAVIDGVEIQGGCNGAVYLDSVHGHHVSRLTNRRGCSGFNSSGVRRAVFVERNTAVGNTLNGLDCNGLGIYGAILWGGQFGRYADIRLVGFDATGAHASMTAAGEQDANGRYAYVWFGAGGVPWAEFTFGGEIQRVRVRDCTATEAWGSAIWLHDHFWGNAVDLQAWESRVGDQLCYVGVRVHDCSFNVAGVQALGHRVSMLVENDPSNCMLRDVNLIPALVADGGIAALYLDTITARGMRFDGLVFGNAGFTPMFAWGPSFSQASNADQWLLENVQTDAPGLLVKADHVFFAYQPDNHTLSFGQYGQLQAGQANGTRYVRPPNDAGGQPPTTRAVGILQGRNFGGAGWVACQDLGGRHFLYCPAAESGDAIRPADPNGSDNQAAVVDNAPASLAVARSITSKVTTTQTGAGYAQLLPGR